MSELDPLIRSLYGEETPPANRYLETLRPRPNPLDVRYPNTSDPRLVTARVRRAAESATLDRQRRATDPAFDASRLYDALPEASDVGQFAAEMATPQLAGGFLRRSREAYDRGDYPNWMVQGMLAPVGAAADVAALSGLGGVAGAGVRAFERGVSGPLRRIFTRSAGVTPMRAGAAVATPALEEDLRPDADVIGQFAANPLRAIYGPRPAR